MDSESSTINWLRFPVAFAQGEDVELRQSLGLSLDDISSTPGFVWLREDTIISVSATDDADYCTVGTETEDWTVRVTAKKVMEALQ